jgi:hypothetical protein
VSSCHGRAGSVRVALLLLYDVVMRRMAAAFVWMMALVAAPAFAADDPPPDPQPPPSKSKLPRDLKVDQGGGIHFTKHFAVFFGGIKQGSSIAAGPAVSWESKDGAYLQVKGGFSVRQFKLLQALYNSRPLFGKRSRFGTRLRWQDAPELPLFQAGPDSPNRHLTIGMTKTEWSAGLSTSVAPRTYVSVGGGVEGYSSKGKWADLAEAIERIGDVPDAPGLATRPWYATFYVAASHDNRRSPYYSRTGRSVDARFDDYHDLHDGTQSFQRFVIGAAQKLPTFSIEGTSGPPETQYRGALSLFGRAWMSHTGEGREVPIYLMTYLGGGDYLRGYSSYRFHDRNALLFGTEYRYGIHKFVDLAVLLEAGTVAPTPGAFSLDEMAGSAAIGVRVHTKTSEVLRLDLAHGRDGFKLAVGMGIGS